MGISYSRKSKRNVVKKFTHYYTFIQIQNKVPNIVDLFRTENRNFKNVLFSNVVSH